MMNDCDQRGNPCNLHTLCNFWMQFFKWFIELLPFRMDAISLGSFTLDVWSCSKMMDEWLCGYVGWCCILLVLMGVFVAAAAVVVVDIFGSVVMALTLPMLERLSVLLTMVGGSGISSKCKSSSLKILLANNEWIRHSPQDGRQFGYYEHFTLNG